jgi:hypothetical protein
MTPKTESSSKAKVLGQTYSEECGSSGPVLDERPPSSKVRLVSDGTSIGTHVIDQETGKELPCRAIKWELTPDSIQNGGNAVLSLDVFVSEAKLGGVAEVFDSKSETVGLCPFCQTGTLTVFYQSIDLDVSTFSSKKGVPLIKCDKCPKVWRPTE